MLLPCKYGPRAQGPGTIWAREPRGQGPSLAPEKGAVRAWAGPCALFGSKAWPLGLGFPGPYGPWPLGSRPKFARRKNDML